MSYNTYPQNPFPPNSENAGGGTSYELPIASTTELGGIKVGSGLAINAETGVLINNYTLPSDVIRENDIAFPFDENSSYTAGDFCYYDGTLYRCETDHSGAWDANDFFAVKVCDSIISEFGDGLRRTGQTSIAVKLETDGGISFGTNGGLQAETNFNANTYPSVGNSTQIGRIIRNNTEYPVYRGFMEPPFPLWIQENSTYANFMNPVQFSLPIDERALNIQFYSGDMNVSDLLVVDRSSGGGYLHIYKSFNTAAVQVTKIMVEYYLTT